MTKAEQLTLDGEPEPYEQVAARARNVSALTGLQREILTRIRLEGPIRAVEAGVMQHVARGRRCSGGGKGYGPTKVACCKYAATDGLEAMKRLRDRGLVRQRKDKTWELA